MNAMFYTSFLKIILLFCGIFVIFTSSYANSASGKILDTTGSTISQITPEIEDVEKNNKAFSGEKWESKSWSLDTELVKTEEEEEEEQKLKQDINTYIIESYKAQWSKIIKDLSVKLTKSIPAKDDRKQAYKKIRSSLEIRLEKTGKLKMSETKKLILKEFLSHMIDLLDKKIDELN